MGYAFDSNEMASLKYTEVATVLIYFIPAGSERCYYTFSSGIKAVKRRNSHSACISVRFWSRTLLPNQPILARYKSIRRLAYNNNMQYYSGIPGTGGRF